VFGYLGRLRLNALRDQLDAGSCRKVIDTLKEIDSQREPIESVLERDYAWALETSDWKMRVALTLSSRSRGVNKSLQGLRKPAEDVARSSERRDQAQLRLLMTHLAIRRYRLSHGKNPESLTELVPDDLSAVPLDPFSGRRLIYRLNPGGDEAYLLYSVGPDRVDDGGQPIPKKSDPLTAKGDYVLD
jgi:hypothetical protein